jgi:hypothetical protein
MMIPALAHSSTPGRRVGDGVSRLPDGTRPVIEVTRTVIVPSPASGWCTK